MEPTPNPTVPQTFTVMLDGVPVQYTVRRHTRAKSMRITISPQQGVVVTLPAQLKQYVNPEDFLREKKDWVLRHLPKVAPASPTQEIQDGSTIYYRGNPLVLRIHPNVVPLSLILHNEGELHICPAFNQQQTVKEMLQEWLFEKASIMIREDVQKESERMGLASSYGNITIRNQKTKWGSCSKQGNLSFNWRLILFPDQVRRYIIIHELCHLWKFDHSPEFWDLVERFDPCYQSSLTWLKDHAAEYERDVR